MMSIVIHQTSLAEGTVSKLLSTQTDTLQYEKGERPNAISFVSVSLCAKWQKFELHDSIIPDIMQILPRFINLYSSWHQNGPYPNLV